MASPVDSARQGTNITTAGTSHAINVGSPSSGTLLIVFILTAADPSVTSGSGSGYTGISPTGGYAGAGKASVFYRWADGSEGATDTFTTTNSVKLAAICWQITGAENPATTAPVASATWASGTGANPDPASLSPGSVQDWLFIEMAGLDGETQTFAASTNYLNITNANSGTGGAAASNVRIGGATRAVTASGASENPDAMTAAAPSTGWISRMIAIQPPAAAAAPGPASSRRQRRASRFLTMR